MIGQTLNNRYKITEHLGKGAMGTVYRATDTQAGQEVAIKVISGDLALDPEGLERFKREGEALRKLKHPNIVGYLDAFQHDEQYVIVMEYVSGGSLYELLKSGPLPIDRARQIALDLCDALIRAHRLNIIHRDIKPENILMDEDGTPKLADFGVARLSEGTRMTRSGMQVGTPYYMSPEAWEGNTLDAQADVWSLGVILFEMLSGQVPFDGDTGPAVMTKVVSSPPPDLMKLRKDVPLGLVKIITLMLTRDKKKRYPTMREVAVDLEREQRATTGVPAKKVKPARWLPALFGFGLIVAVSAVWLVTQAPVADSTNTPRPTSTIIRTSVPTTTPNLPDGEAFAAPILAAIADRPPDFEDDFSTDKGWREGRGWTTPSIQDGQLYLQVGANIEMSMINPIIRYRNFVMVVDSTVQEFAGKNTVIAISWGAWGNSMNFDISAVQTWTSSWCGPTATCPEIYESGPVRLEKDVPVNLMVIVRGNEWAAYVDGALLAYVNDSAHSVPDDFIALRGWADAETRSAIITHDNFKIWNLDTVPGLP